MLKRGYVLSVVAVIISIMICSCGKSEVDNRVSLQKTSEMDMVVASEMGLAAQLEKEQTLAAIHGGEYDISKLDCTSLAETMEEYNDVLRYNNLYVWMCSVGLYEPVESFDDTSFTISEEDYEKMIAAFYAMSDDEKNQVLQHMFKETGAYSNQEVAVTFDYVPTGEVGEDGTELTVYDATDIRTVSTKVYASIPLEIEYK